MADFIKIDRKILEWEWYKNEHTKNVFFHCLFKAHIKDMEISGKIIPRGSFVSSISKISEEISLTPMEVRTALKHLKSTNEITSKGTNKNTIFTVTNFDMYQSKEQESNDTYLSERKRIIEYLNTICGTKYKYDRYSTKKHINARLSDGYGVDDFFEVIDKKYREWHGTEREKYLRPETLFGNKFEGYLNQVDLKKEKRSENFERWLNSDE